MKSFGIDGRVALQMAAAVGFVLTVSFVARAGGGFRLAENGVAKAEIVLGEQASWAAKWGAVELRHLLRAVTGGDFKIVAEKSRTPGLKPIFVGASEGAAKLGIDAAKLGPQQHVIAVTPDALALVGVDEPPDLKEPALPKMEYAGLNTFEGSGRSPFPSVWTKHGSLEAVYGFLEEQCGVAFLDPTDDGTTVESRPTLDVPCATRTVEPWVASRDLGIYQPSYWPRKHPGSLRYAKACYPFAYRPGRFTAAVINAQNELYLLRMRVGGAREIANHSFGNWHERFLDTNSVQFVAFHPEYFAHKPAEAKGERYIEAQWSYRDRPPQLCYTHPDVIRQAVRDVRDYFDNGGRPVYGKDGRIVRYDPYWGADSCCLEPMDNEGFCTCKRCRAEYPPYLATTNSWFGVTRNEYWFRFVNKVAKEVKKTHPTKRVSTLAYWSHTAPPSFRMEDNVDVHFCHHSNRSPFSWDFADLLTEQLKDWHGKLAPGHLGIWFYNGIPGGAMDFVFPGFFSRLHARQYREWVHGYQIRRGVFYCGCHDHFENYAICRWMWNPLEDLETLRARHFRSYGPAAPEIRAISDLIERRYCDRKLLEGRLQHWQDEYQAWVQVCPQEVQEEIDARMARALAAPGLEGQALRRTQCFKLAYVDYINAGATFDTELPQAKPGVTVTLRKYLPKRNRAPKPLDGDLIGPAAEFALGAFDEDAAKVRPLRKTTALNDRRDGSFCFDAYGVTNVLYACVRKVPALRRLRVSIHGGDTMRARALVTPVGLKGGKWIRLADEVGRELTGGGKNTLDFAFEKGTVPDDLEAIGIVESGKRERFNGPRFDAIEALSF